MKKKFVVILLCVALGVSSLNGCGGEEKGTEMSMAQKPEDENAIYGEVSDIKEDAITIKIGTRKEMKQPEGEPPEQPDGEQPEGMPEQPDGEQPEGMPEQPDGEQPEGMPEQPNGKQADGEQPQEDGEQRGERPAMLDLNGEEEEIAITQETVIKRQGEEISVSDISEGDVVMIISAEDEDAAEINVISGMPGGGRDVAPMDKESKKNDGTV